jgi:endonuclease/exonuclease/phosphatase family metal-dependent hydrolase
VPELRVVSYNVHSLRDDVAALTAVVRDLAPDVLIMQEAPRRFRWRQKCARLAADLGMIYAVGGLPSLGNLIVTNMRVRVHETSTFQFPLTPGRHMRGAAFARCSVDRAPFTVVGSHLSLDTAERPAQATLLKKAMSDVDAPVVLGADINENSGGAAWRTLADGLVDVGARAGDAARHTFSCAIPVDRIDVVFVDPRLTVRDYDVVDTSRTRLASDHFPVVADLTLPEAGAT